MAVTASGLAASCSQVLGLKEPSLDDTSSPGIDAPVDTPVDTARDAPLDTTGACVPAACPFGCDADTNVCRDGKLWIFKTGGAFIGNAFGGTDVPINVRGGADGRCRATYTSLYGARHCNNNRVHAVLHVNGTDSLDLMASTYTIPTNVPVHRADDNVLVSDNWNELTDPSKEPHAAATTAATDAQGIVWTGTDTVATCSSWTSATSTDMGRLGFTNRREATWLSHDTLRCDRLAGLLCVCWSGGE